MNGINTITLVGNLGSDPEIRTSQSGNTIAKLSVATSRWDKQSETDITDWHRVITFGKSAEFMQKFAKKGSQVALTGSLQYSEFDGKEGRVRLCEIVTFKVELCGSKVETEGMMRGGRGADTTTQRTHRHAPGPHEPKNDDIPF